MKLRTLRLGLVETSSRAMCSGMAWLDYMFAKENKWSESVDLLTMVLSAQDKKQHSCRPAWGWGGGTGTDEIRRILYETMVQLSIYNIYAYFDRHLVKSK